LLFLFTLFRKDIKECCHIAIYHCSIKIFCRGKGKSAVAAAAYRACEKITNERDGKIHDYSRKQGIAWSGILLPENAPQEYKDRSTLWNAVEKVEKASNSQLAREIEIALPRELHFSEYFSLVLKYVEENFAKNGMCADISIHDPKGNTSNPHAHIMLTMRPLNEDKTWGDKQKKVYHLDDNGEKIYDKKKRQYKCNKMQTTDWNEQHKAEEWRASWADMCNAALENFNRPERIDHRSYARQGIDQIPTIHLGVAAHQMEQRGIMTERGNINRAIEISNRKLRKIEEQINELQGWLAEEMVKLKEQSTLPTQPQTIPPQFARTQSIIPQPQSVKSQLSSEPTTTQLTPKPRSAESKSLQPITKTQPTEPTAPAFADVIYSILQQQARGKIISNSDNQIYLYLKKHDIQDYKGLEESLKKLMGQQREISHKLTPLRERIKEIEGHFDDYEIFKQNRDAHKQYQKDYTAQMPWKKKAFAEQNRVIVENYETSKSIMDSLKNKNGNIPAVTWQKQLDTLSAELRELDKEYKFLKDEVDSVNKIRTKVYDVLRNEQQREQPIQVRTQDMDR